MYFSRFSEKNIFLKAGSKPPHNGGILPGVMLAPTVCLNPAIFPNKKLIWYINESLTTGDRIDWLVDRDTTNQLRLNNSYLQIDFEKLERLTRMFNLACPFPENDEEFEGIELFSRFIYDENGTYEDKLQSFEWQQKRFEIFLNNDFKCAECKRFATFSMVMGLGENQTKHYDIGEFYNPYSNARDITWNGIKSALLFFNSLKIPFITLPNFSYQRLTNTKITLDLHHKYYIKNRRPWEYDDDCFSPMCRECHVKIHAKQEIPIYDDASLKRLDDNSEVCLCSRCSGEGYISRFKHVQNGICFKCWGDGYNVEKKY